MLHLLSLTKARSVGEFFLSASKDLRMTLRHSLIPRSALADNPADLIHRHV